MLLISALDALRRSFGENSVSDGGLSFRVAILGHIVVPEPSRVRVLLCYFAFRGTEYVGSCKTCSLLFLKSLVMERIFVF